MDTIKKWPRFHGEKTETIKRLFLAGETMNVENFGRHFAPNALYQFGNFPVVFGKEGISGASDGFLAKVEGVHHHLKNIWEVEEDTLVVEMDVTYIRHDGQVVTLPCCDIVKLSGEQIKELKIFMDINPALA